MPDQVGGRNEGGTRPSVVVVDDEPDMRLLLRVVLEQTGYEVVGEAADGVEALDCFDLLTPDSMVIDLSMPQMGGVELIKELRERSAIPVVGYSAAPTREDERQLLALGVPLVIKDAGVDALVRVLDAVTSAA